MSTYGIMPGWIISQNDGGEHWVSARQLIRLYRVNPDECVIVPPGKPERQFKAFGLDGLIILRPRYDGNYTLEEYQNE